MFTYSASCDVPEETLVAVTAWLRAHRRDIGLIAVEGVPGVGVSVAG